MPPLSILIWLPAACGVLGAILCTLSGAPAGGSRPARRGVRSESPDGRRAPARWSIPGVLALIGSLGALGLAIGYIADYSPGTPA